MSIYAGHLPTMRFTKAQWDAMKIHDGSDDDEWWGDGFHRVVSAGGRRAIVVHIEWPEGQRSPSSYAVRPIIVVPAAIEPTRPVFLPQEIAWHRAEARAIMAEANASQC